MRNTLRARCDSWPWGKGVFQEKTTGQMDILFQRNGGSTQRTCTGSGQAESQLWEGEVDSVQTISVHGAFSTKRNIFIKALLSRLSSLSRRGNKQGCYTHELIGTVPTHRRHVQIWARQIPAGRRGNVISLIPNHEAICTWYLLEKGNQCSPVEWLWLYQTYPKVHPISMSSWLTQSKTNSVFSVYTFFYSS